jgi:geranylgeranyl reductase family protein
VLVASLAVQAVDVVVVGAGPSGIAASVTLARAGRSVLVIDKARFPRDKCCGDGLTTGALRELERLGFTPDALPSWQVVDDVVVRSPSGREAVFPLPRGRGTYAAVVPRMELDAALVDVARAAGVKVADGHGFEGIAVADDRVVLDVEGLGPVAARYAIAADGMWSPLRRAIGGIDQGYLGEWHAFRQYFRNVDGRGARELAVWFEADLLPGYAGSFPLPDGRANVGFGIQRGSGPALGDMGRLWPEILRRPAIAPVLGPKARPEGPHRAWPIPARIGRVALSAAGGRALFVGDAAAATDPLTGEGIGQALLTGVLAAEAVIAAGPHDVGAAAARYERAVRRELAADHAFAAGLSRLLRSRGATRLALAAAGASGWTRRNFARWMFEDYPRALLGTPSRWGRGALRPPPPYGVHHAPTATSPAR